MGGGSRTNCVTQSVTVGVTVEILKIAEFLDFLHLVGKRGSPTTGWLASLIFLGDVFVSWRAMKRASS